MLVDTKGEFGLTEVTGTLVDHSSATGSTISDPPQLGALNHILDEQACDMFVFPHNEPENPRKLRLSPQHKWPAFENLDIW